MAKVDFVRNDITYSTTLNPDIKFHIVINSYDNTDTKGTNNERSFINGIVDNICVASDCLTAANQAQTYHATLRDKSAWITSGDNYSMIEFLAQVCDNLSVANTETTVKDKDKNDITVREIFKKDPDYQVIDYSVFVEGMCVHHETYQLVYNKTTDYSDNNVSLSCVTNPAILSNFVDIKNNVISEIGNNRIVRKLVVPDNETSTYTTQQYSYKYTSDWYITSEEISGIWYTTAGFKLSYGVDTPDNQLFAQKQYTFDNTNFHNADAALKAAYNDSLNDLKDYLDSLSGVKLMTNGFERDSFFDPKTISEDRYDQTPAYSRSRNTNELVLSATGTVDNYDSSVISLLNFDDGVIQDRAGLTWTVNGAAETTVNHSKFAQGLKISNKAYVRSEPCILGWTIALSSAAKVCSFTIDFFAWIETSSPSGWLFRWHNIGIKYDSVTGNVLFFYSETDSISSSDPTVDYGAEIVTNATHHFAIVQRVKEENVSTMYFYVNGVRIGAIDNVIIPSTASAFTIGDPNSTIQVTYDEIKISNGIARWYPKDVQIGKVVGKAGDVWTVRESKNGVLTGAKAQGTLTTIDQDPIQGALTATTGKFGKGVQFDGKTYITLETPITFGGADFTIDFWIKFESTRSCESGVFEIGNDTHSLGFHYHRYNANAGKTATCIHGSLMSNQVQTAYNLDQFLYFVFTYSHSKKEFQAYCNGTTMMSKPRTVTIDESVFQLIIGRFNGRGGPAGYFKGVIENLRVTVGKILSPTDAYTQPYNITQEPIITVDGVRKYQYTKALFNSDALSGTTGVPTTDDDIDTSNPNRDFQIPTEPYNNVVGLSDSRVKRDYFIQLNSYLDDNIYTIIPYYPVQKDIPTYQEGISRIPVFDHYDSTKMIMAGQSSAVDPGDYYVTFTPVAGYVWKNGSSQPKRVIWSIKRQSSSGMPEQEEPLIFNGSSQEVNLIGYNPDIMILSGTTTAIYANTSDNPYYTVTISLKPGYSWSTGLTTPYSVQWVINPQPVNKPSISGSFSFVYDGSPKSLTAVYNTNLINVTGNVQTVANATGSGKSKISGEELNDEDKYNTVFSLKDKLNYCWQNDGEGEIDTEDIMYPWIIKRQQIVKPSFSNGSKVYNGTEQGPTILPATWNTNIYQVTGHKGTAADNYTATVHLVDTANYEWTDGTTGDMHYNWIITQIEGDVSLSRDTLVLRATQESPTPQADIKVIRLGTGPISCSQDPAVSTEIDGDIITVFGLKNTYGKKVTITVTIGNGGNYTGTTTTFTVQVIRGLDAFSWQQIAEMAANNTLLSVTYIGDSKALPVKANTLETNYIPSSALTDELLQKDRLVLFAVSHNPEIEGSGKATFLFYNTLDNSGIEQYMSVQMSDNTFNNTNTTVNGWIGSDIRRRISTFERLFDYANFFPDDLMSAIIPVIKWQDNVGDSVNKKNCVTPTLEYLTVPAEKEVTGSVAYANSAEDLWQQQYRYFADNPSALQRQVNNGTSFSVANGFYLRSVAAESLSDNKAVVRIDDVGRPTRVSVHKQMSDLLPFITISTKQEDKLWIPDIDICYEALLHCDNSSIVDICSNVYERVDTVSIWSESRHINPTLSTDIKKFGNAFLTNGTIDRVISKNTITLGSHDWTIDFWCNIKTIKNNGILFYLYSSKAQLQVRMVTDNGHTCLSCDYLDKQEFHDAITELSWISQKSADITTSTWYHVAIISKAGRIYLSVNGKITCPGISAVLPRYQYDIFIGGKANDTSFCTNCIFDEIRIVNGVAAFTVPDNVKTGTANTQVTAFTPPTAAYSDSAYLIKDQRTKAVKVTLDNSNPTLSLTIQEHDGIVQVMSTDPSIVSAYVNTVTAGSDITESIVIEGHKVGTARIVIWTKDTALTYGTVRSIDVTCNSNIAFKALADCTPDEIKHIVRTGNALNAWKLGDQTAPIELTSSSVDGSFLSKTVRATLIGVDHNKDLETNGFLSAHFMLEGLDRTFTVTAETNGWQGSNARNLFCQQVFAALPVAWRNVIVPCTKYTDNNTMSLTDSNVISATEDNLWLLSNYEVTGTVAETANDLNPFEYEKQKQYDYFKTATTPASWLRTFNVITRSFVKKGNDINFCFVISDYSGAQKLDPALESFSSNNVINYDSSMHNPIEENIITYNNYDPVNTQFYSFSGDISKSDVGNYTIKVRPATGYVWSDGSNSERNILWSINTTVTELLISQEDVRLYSKNPTQTLTVTRENTAVLTYTVDNPSLISVQISGNSVTLTATGTGTTVLTITSPAVGNYSEQQAVVFVKSSIVPALNTLDPTVIQSTVLLGHASLAWDIGDCTKDILISGNLAGQQIEGTYNAFILGFDHNSAIEGTKRLHLCFAKTNDNEKKAVAFGLTTMSDSAVPAINGWEAEPLRDNLQNFIACLPTTWRQVISPCVKNYNTPSTLKDVNTVTDYVWLLSKPEIFKTDNMISQQYQYFANANPTVRYQNDNLNTAVSWYLRTLLDAQHYDVVSNQGAAASFVPNNPAAIVPCVTIGSTKTFPDMSVSPTTLSLTVGSTKFLTVTKPSAVTISAKSSDITVVTATVSGNKINVTGIKTGTATITVRTVETDSYSFNCVQVPVTVGVIEKTDATLELSNTVLNISPDSGANFTAIATGGIITNVVSSNTSIVIVTKVNDTTYNVMGRTVGQAVISVTVTGDSTHNNVTGCVTVNVGNIPTLTKIPSDITIDGTSESIFVYDGTEKDITTKLTGYNTTYVDITGTFKATNHKDNSNYIFSLTPKTGYEWNEGGTQVKNFEWNIAKAAGIISGTTNIVLLKDSTISQTLSYSITDGSTFFVKSNSDSSLLTVTVSANNVSFSSSCLQDKNVTVILATTATLNYTAAELTVTVVIKTANLTVIPTTVPSIAESSYVTYDPAKSYTYSDIISKISNFNTTYHKLTAVTSQTVGSVNITNGDITTVTISNADIYTIFVTPNTGYCWNSQNDVSRKDLTFKINRRVLTDTNAQVTGPVIETTAFTTSYTPLASEFTYSSTYLVFDHAVAGSTAGTYKAYFKPASNWCWSDNTYGTREYTWTIVDPSAVSDIPKPSAANLTFTYNGEEQGINIADIVDFPQEAINQGKVVVTAANLLAEQYSSTNEITEEYSLTDTTVRYTATDAGQYKIIFTLNSGEKWIDDTTDPVEFTYTIQRKGLEMPTFQTEFKVQALSFSSTTGYPNSLIKQSPDLSNIKNFNIDDSYSQALPGTYYVALTPLKNYKWISGSDVIATREIPWTILPGDPAIKVSNVVCQEISLDSPLTDNSYTISFDITGFTGIPYSSQNHYYDINVAKINDATYHVTVNGLRAGNNTAKLQLHGTKFNNVTAFYAGTIPIEYKLNITHETDSLKQPITFMKNFVKYLTWDWDIKNSITESLNNALSKATNGHYTSFDTIISEMKDIAVTIRNNANTKYNFNTKTVDFYNEVAKNQAPNYYDIDFGNSKVTGASTNELQNLSTTIDIEQDDGSLLGKDIGQSSEPITYKDLIKENDPSTLSEYPTQLEQTYDGLTVVYPASSTLTSNEKWVVRIAHTWWFKNCLAVLKKALGLSFQMPQARSGSVMLSDNPQGTGKTIETTYDLRKMPLEFTTELETNALAQVLIAEYSAEQNEFIKDLEKWWAGSSTAYIYTVMTCQFNKSLIAQVTQSSSNYSVEHSSGFSFDAVLLHELVHAVMVACVPIFNMQFDFTPLWFTEGIAELVRGVDRTRFGGICRIICSPDIIQGVYDCDPDSENYQAFRLLTYNLGYIMFRYLIKKYRAGDFDKPA